MKFSQIGRLLVFAGTIFGTVVVVSSQPGGVRAQQGYIAPSHSLIHKSVDISQVQEFKDAGTIHLNESQKLMMSSVGKAFPTKTYIITKVDFWNVWHDQFIILKDATTAGGGAGRPTTPAELAVLSYVFDQGIDRIAKGTEAKGTASPSSITGSISPKDFGMTSQQFKQSVMMYVENHQSRFWNEARVGLASNR